MENAYWHAKWDNRDTAFDQQEPNVLLKAHLNKFSFKPGEKILVPLAGKSIDMEWLRQQGFFVVGVELSEMACERFFGEYGLSYTTRSAQGFVIFETEGLTLFCGDFFAFTADMMGTFNAVYDRAALVALPEAMREQYARHVMSLCGDHAQIFLVSIAYDQSEMKGPPFSVDDAEITKLFAPRFQLEKLHDQPLLEIPPHWRAKGLTALRDMVCRLH